MNPEIDIGILSPRTWPGHCPPWGANSQVMVNDGHGHGHGHGGHHGGHGGDKCDPCDPCAKPGFTLDSLLRESEACFRAIGQDFATTAAATALASCNTDKTVLNSFAALQLQQERVRFDLAAQAAAFAAAQALAAEKNRCELAAEIAKCCCETQALIRAEAVATRQQATDFRLRDLERFIDRLGPSPVPTCPCPPPVVTGGAAAVR